MRSDDKERVEKRSGISAAATVAFLQTLVFPLLLPPCSERKEANGLGISFDPRRRRSAAAATNAVGRGECSPPCTSTSTSARPPHRCTHSPACVLWWQQSVGCHRPFTNVCSSDLVFIKGLPSVCRFPLPSGLTRTILRFCPLILLIVIVVSPVD